MVKRKPTSAKNLVDLSRKRRKRITGNPASRKSLRRTGIKGDLLEVLFPDGSPTFRFSPKEYKRPICRMYGLDRYHIYKGFYFCSNCKLADEMSVMKGLFKASCRPVGSRTVCLAQHNFYAYPTNKGIEHYYLKVCESAVNEDSSYLLNQRKKKAQELTGTSSNSNRLIERTSNSVIKLYFFVKRYTS